MSSGLNRASVNVPSIVAVPGKRSEVVGVCTRVSLSIGKKHPKTSAQN